MNPFVKIFTRFFIRFLLIIVLFLFYLKYRNNQCIKNQNCQPFFISHILSFKKTFKTPHLIIYKIQDNLANIDIFPESFLSIEDLQRDKDLNPQQRESIIYLIKNYKEVFSDFSVIKNNDIIIKKFSLKNTSKTPIEVLPKMLIKSEEDQKNIKIYNCFCDSKITVEPLSTKSIFIYFESKKSKNYTKDQLMQISTIDISI